MTTRELPEQGFIFWPVWTGDSTTISVADGITMQVDLHHCEESEDDADPRTPIAERLEELLPQIDGRPYLSTFVLTHPDQDHCLGFGNLLERVTIGELWFSPRVFREYTKDLCDDAILFRKEAKRRVRRNISLGGATEPGDRVRIIGHDDLLSEENYQGFPSWLLTVPGNAVTSIDGYELTGTFRAFVHAPFKDSADGERNATSIALQISLYRGEATGRLLLLGDHCYPTLKRIFEISEGGDLLWNAMLAPHHCSKSAMYWRDSDGDNETLRRDILEQMEGAADPNGPAYIVASSEPIPDSNKPGDNPPHAKARNRYQEIAPDGFLCTHEYPDESHPAGIAFALLDTGLTLVETEGDDEAEDKALATAVSTARGRNEPPRERVGFGQPD